MRTDQVRLLLDTVPKVSLGFFPTPLYKLEKLSTLLGVNLYIKRDDFSGKNLFGGNKTRKLEFLIGRALADGCESVFTYGATQSNHAMQTVWASVSNGLKPILYLAAVVEPDEKDCKANLLLDQIFDAEIHIVKMQDGETFAQAEERSFQMGAAHMKRLEAEGHKCLNIPMGGASDVGSVGYVSGMTELQKQARELGVSFDYLYHACGSGGTMAGLVAGKKLLEIPTKIRSVLVTDVGPSYVSAMAELANRTLAYIGAEAAVSEDDFDIDPGFYGTGYERPTPEATEAIKLLAKTEGLLLDPVYTGKGFSGLLSDIRSGKVEAGSNVVFLHTGGATALFAERDILGGII